MTAAGAGRASTAVTGRDIVCLSTQYWDERRFRKQEFMSRFSRENRVLFVEPSYSMARSPERHVRAFATNRFLVPRLEQRDDRLHLLKPPRGLPKWSDPRVERATYAWYGRVVQRAIERLRFRDVLLWVYAPAYVHGLGAIRHRHLVFDLVDDLAAYGGDESAASSHLGGSVERLVRRCDLLVVSAATLLDTYGALARRVVQISNGYDAELFSRTTAVGADDPLPDVPRPILGFVGTIFRFLDFELLEHVARVHADKSLVLVGPVEATARAPLERLMRHPNVVHVASRPRSEIPRYVAVFDVCLNPFRRSRVADSVNPLKVYEYLAAGKPVVSTPMEALRREPAGSMVAFAGDGADFCAAIDRALADGMNAAEARRAAAAPYSWDRLFSRLDAACAESLAG